ncbi:MAG: hypothetical protein Q8T08_22295 [Ignavibacteria bacterium]|nr:hypothetical protein [Ignavibacteria bacterium]
MQEERQEGTTVKLSMGPVVEEEVEMMVEDIQSEEETTDDVEDVNHQFILDEGDIYVFQSGSIALNILAISKQTALGKFYRVRMLSTIHNPIDVSEDELINYINENDLIRLDTYRDQMEAIAAKLLLNQGDVYTKNGDFFMEILSVELLYIDALGKSVNIIGVRTGNDVIAYRDALWVKSSVYGNTDQFPAQILNENEGE